jgi:tight adherence protein C
MLKTNVGNWRAPTGDPAESASLVDRVVLPVASKLAAAARRVTTAAVLKRIEKRLVLAGRPEQWDGEKIAAIKLVGLSFGILLALALFGFRGGLVSFGPILLFGGVAYFAPDAILDGLARQRQREIRAALPDTIDLLTISVEAGLGFQAALARVIHKVPGPLSEEIARMLQEMQLGVSRADAFRQLAERTDLDELRAFVLAVVHADTFGISIGQVLRVQAKDLRMKRKQRAEKSAMQTPVKILFPLILCVLPALFVVVIGPGAIRIFNNFFGAVGP